MLTRVRHPRRGKPSEDASVARDARVRPTDASSVRGSRTPSCRHAGSGTKRGGGDGCLATFPRGDALLAEESASPEKSGRGGNARVFVLGKHKKPLMPCTPARARRLLAAGRAVVV